MAPKEGILDRYNFPEVNIIYLSEYLLLSDHEVYAPPELGQPQIPNVLHQRTNLVCPRNVIWSTGDTRILS